MVNEFNQLFMSLISV